MATTFAWDEATQSMRPVSSHSIEQLNNDEVNVNTPQANTPDSVEATQAEAKATVSDSEAIKAAKAKILAAKHDLLRAQGKEPGKKGKPKVYTFERVMFGAQVSKDNVDKLKALMPGANNTALVNAAVECLIASLEAKAVADTDTVQA